MIFSTLTKGRTSRDNTKFGVAQVVDILFQKWFSTDLTFIIQEFEGKDEPTSHSPLEI
jgi:hypothetical protein